MLQQSRQCMPQQSRQTGSQAFQPCQGCWLLPSCVAATRQQSRPHIQVLRFQCIQLRAAPHLDCCRVHTLRLHGIRRHRQPLPLLRARRHRRACRQRRASEGLQSHSTLVGARDVHLLKLRRLLSLLEVS